MLPCVSTQKLKVFLSGRWKTNVRNTLEIVRAMTIGLATTSLQLQYCRNPIGDEHRACDHRFTCELLAEIVLSTNIGFVITAAINKTYCVRANLTLLRRVASMQQLL